MEQDKNSCCPDMARGRSRGFLAGILYGLIPHSFCIAFILFSVIGAATAVATIKKFLLIPYFFYFLLAVSIVLATISSVIYLKKNNCLCASGIKDKWKYITTLYSVTILVNLFMFFVIFPALANFGRQGVSSRENNLAELSIDVQIPCSGHASLIIDEIKKDGAVQSIRYETPNTFEIAYDPQKTTSEKIASLEIFKTYAVSIN